MSEEAVESLSDILSGPRTEAPVEATKVAPVEAKVETPKVARDETGKFAKTEAEKVAEGEKVVVDKTPDKPADKISRADVAAIIDERRKRQELQTELDKLRQAAPVKKPSVFEDEDGAIRSRLDEATRPLRTQLFNQSMRIAAKEYGDKFAEAQEGFMEATKANAALISEWQNADDPGEFLYRHGLFHKKLSAVGGDLTKFEEQVTATTKAELDALKTQYDALKAENEKLKGVQTDLDNLPKSLNNRASRAAPTGEAGDEDDLKTIVRFGNKSR